MKKVFVICSVREGTPHDVFDYVNDIEQADCIVHLPPRDTDQDDTTGYRICTDNMNAIKWADEVHVWYDQNSKGSHFDLGVAFALGKKIVFVNKGYYLDIIGEDQPKSFANMMDEWETK